MDARSIIRRVRDGGGLDADQARWFARGLADGTVDDAQAGAFAMAVLLRGLGEGGRVALTQAMRDSGQVMTWDLPGPVIDKHSTGGVGDSTSLILAPALAACGCFVPMISGRGLGHTGGTLDKMEAIPGYRTDIDTDTLRRVVAKVGCAIIGQTDDIAPADRRLYAIRDISGTVESIDLITASILSKKLAAGLDGLVLDVKCGSGAFMPDLASARALAGSLVDTAKGAGCKTAALITDMNSPLGWTAGNSCEVAECIAVMTGGEGYSEPLRAVTVALGAEALVLAGLAASPEDGTARIERAISSGAAAEKFQQMVAALGGPHDLIDNPGAYLAVGVAEHWRQPPANARWVKSIDTRALGEIVVRLGGGRLRSGDRIDHSVGLYGLARVGDELDDDLYQAAVFGIQDKAVVEGALDAIEAAYTMSPTPIAPDPLILDHIR